MKQSSATGGSRERPRRAQPHPSTSSRGFWKPLRCPPLRQNQRQLGFCHVTPGQPLAGSGPQPHPIRTFAAGRGRGLTASRLGVAVPRIGCRGNIHRPQMSFGVEDPEPEIVKEGGRGLSRTDPRSTPVPSGPASTLTPRQGDVLRGRVQSALGDAWGLIRTQASSQRPPTSPQTYCGLQMA